jgi:hypothetical protein
MRLLVAWNLRLNAGVNPHDRQFRRSMNRAFTVKAPVAQGRAVLAFSNSADEADLRTDLAIRTRDNHHVTVRVAEPNFSVLGCRVDVRLFNNLSA